MVLRFPGGWEQGEEGEEMGTVGPVVTRAAHTWDICWVLLLCETQQFTFTLPCCEGHLWGPSVSGLSP